MLRRFVAKRATVDRLIWEVERLRPEVETLSQEVERLSSDLSEAHSKAEREAAALAEARAEIEELSKPESFSGHYYDWRVKRQMVITDHFGAEWFRGKRVLELACGYGDIGAYFMSLRATVTFSEAREEHLNVIRSRYPSLSEKNVVQWNSEEGIPDGDFDLIIHGTAVLPGQLASLHPGLYR